jgi:hypothetical protein
MEKSEETKKLIENPTVVNWEIEIRNILLGEREYILFRLGDIQSYINKIHSKSIKRSVSETNFNIALKKIISQWNLYENRRFYYYDILFDFISNYLVNEGIPKLIEFIGIGTHQYDGLDNELSNEELDLKLHKKAIISLYLFFKEYRNQKSKYFKTYKCLISNLLTNESLSGIASAIIINQNFIEKPVDYSPIGKIIKTNKKALNDILTFFLSEDISPKLSRDLGHIYSHSIIEDGSKKSYFELILEERKLKLIEQTYSISIIFPSGRSIDLEIPEEHWAEVHKYICNKSYSIGMESLSNIFPS